MGSVEKLFYHLMTPDTDRKFNRLGINVAMFSEAERRIFRSITEYTAKHGVPPKMEKVLSKYPGFVVEKTDRPITEILEEIQEQKGSEEIFGLITQLKIEHPYFEFGNSEQLDSLDGLNTGAVEVPNKEDIDYATEAIRKTLQKLTHLSASESDVTKPFESFSDIIQEYKLRKIGESHGIPIPFPQINSDIRGWHKGHLSGFLARPGRKKTFVLCLCAIESAASGEKTLLASSEMTSLELKWRVAALALGLPYSLFSAGNMPEGMEERLEVVDEAVHAYDAGERPADASSAAALKRFSVLYKNLYIAGPSSVRSIADLEQETVSANASSVMVDNLAGLAGDGVDDKERFRFLLQDAKSFSIRRNAAVVYTSHQNRYGGKSMGGTAYSDAFNAWSSYMFNISGKDNYIDIKSIKVREGKSDITYRYNADLDKADWSFIKRVESDQGQAQNTLL